jgi:hypothetical protein
MVTTKPVIFFHSGRERPDGLHADLFLRLHLRHVGDDVLEFEDGVLHEGFRAPAAAAHRRPTPSRRTGRLRDLADARVRLLGGRRSGFRHVRDVFERLAHLFERRPRLLAECGEAVGGRGNVRDRAR